MTFLLIVEKAGVAVVTRRYQTASLCCEGFIKAEAYYTGLGESVRLVMKDEYGRMITSRNVDNSV